MIRIGVIGTGSMARVHAKAFKAMEGAAVLCEKPVPASLGEAGMMLKAAKSSGVINMVSHSKRNSSALQWAAQPRPVKVTV